MKHEIFWENPSYKARPELTKDISCDYLIIGGGITGISTAYFLAKQGAKNIVIIEKNHIGSGATGKAAGTLVLRGESDLIQLIEHHGKKRAELYWEEIHEGMRGIKKVIEEENIDCDAEPQDTLYCDTAKKTDEYLVGEYEAEKSIEKSTIFLEGEALKKEINTPFFTHGILSKNHGLSVNPLKCVQNFSKAVEKYGVKIYEDTSLLDIKDNTAKTNRGDIQFKKCIIAIDAKHPSEEVKNIKSTIVITRTLSDEELVSTGLNKKKIVFDSQNHYYYFKVTKDNRLLFGFGGIKVHKKYNKVDPHFPHLNNIKKFMKKLFPYLDLKLEYTWAGTFGSMKHFAPPLIEYKNNTVAIAGAATQVVCFLAAKHVANKLLGKPSKLDVFFA
jgi:glycine/D-amino acid oxidase-like deaminating enzyme